MNNVPVPNVEKSEVAKADDMQEHDRRWETVRTSETVRHKMLAPFTISWFVRLPAEVRPPLLASHFPRIANTLAIAWGARGRGIKAVEDLLWDRRGDRKGFPMPIYRELQKLHQFLMASFSAEHAGNAAVRKEQAESEGRETAHAIQRQSAPSDKTGAA